MRGLFEQTRCSAWFLPAVFFVLWPGQGAALDQSSQTPSQAAAAPAPSVMPLRLEFGGYYSWTSRGYGNWRGLNAELWWRGNSKFIPAFFFDSQTRPAGTQQNYAFMSYANWTRSLYTVQSVSWAPQQSAQAIYFPKVRFDVKAYWKRPPERRLVFSAGFTHFDFGRPGRGQIYNLGAQYYWKKLVVEGNAFINQSQPGNLWSGSGSLAVQYGTEGRYWFGVTTSGGRELYRYESLTPVDVRLNSYTIDLFYRRWISRHVGYVVGGTFQDKLDAYKRGGVYGRLFIEY